MNDRTDLAKQLNKNQRQLLQQLRGTVKDLNSVLKIVAECQDVDSVRREHMDFLGIIGCRTLNEKELAQAKDGGISFDDLRRMCCKKIDSTLGRDTVRSKLESGHVLRMILAEHEMILYLVSNLETILKDPQKFEDWSKDNRAICHIASLVSQLEQVDNHRKMEEQAIFPQLEAAGFKEIPKLLSNEHTSLSQNLSEMRNLLKMVNKTEIAGWAEHFSKCVAQYAPAMKKHINVEESILYPNALKFIQDPDKWVQIKTACEDISISCLESNN